MRGSRLACSRAHDNNRVLADAVEFFRTDAELARRMEQARHSGKRLRVCLEGDTGTSKHEVLRRLSSQGYAVSQLPFVPWLLEAGARSDLSDSELVRHSRLWQEAWHSQVDRDAAATEGRPGLLFIARSPLTSAVELAARGLGPPLVAGAAAELSEEWAVVALETDSIQAQRRVAEKTFNEPSSPSSLLRLRLAQQATAAWKGAHAVVNSTSSKQAVAALLKLVGVQQPSFPRFT